MIVISEKLKRLHHMTLPLNVHDHHRVSTDTRGSDDQHVNI